MNVVLRVILLLVAMAVAGCASRSYDQPIKVDAFAQPDADFTAYKTWNFVEYQNQPDVGVLEDAEVRLQLAKVIQKAMADRGFQRVFDAPDLNLGYLVAKESIDEEQLKKWYDQQGWDLPGYREGAMNQWRAGTIMLFLVDAKTGRMLWRSSAEAFVDTDTPKEERQKTVEKAVQMMLDKMPKMLTQ